VNPHEPGAVGYRHVLAAPRYDAARADAHGRPAARPSRHRSPHDLRRRPARGRGPTTHEHHGVLRGRLARGARRGASGGASATASPHRSRPSRPARRCSRCARPSTSRPARASRSATPTALAHRRGDPGAPRPLPRRRPTRWPPAPARGRGGLPRASLRRQAAMARARARVGRVHAALGRHLRGGLRAPHHLPGRLVPVRQRRQPRLPRPAPARDAADLHGALARARGAPLLGPGADQPGPA